MIRMASELERDFEKIRGMATGEIRRGLAVQAWGSEAKKIAEAELIYRRDTELQQIAATNLEATARLVDQTARLVEVTDHLVDATQQQAAQTRITASATRWLAWATWGLLLVTALLMIRQFMN